MTFSRTRSGRALLRTALAGAVALTALPFVPGTAVAETYDPLNAISDANMRHYDSLSEGQIQSFLESQPGILKDLVTADYDKVITLSKTEDNTNTTPDKGEAPKRASRIIWEACQAWKINPKIILVTLQKEQSLLAAKAPSAKTLARATGAGIPGGLVEKGNPVATNSCPGFGNQVWHAARKLDLYGETHDTNSTRRAWATKGISITEYYTDAKGVKKSRKKIIHPKNIATFKLYTYTPYISGPRSTATYYTKYFFESPLSNPRYRPVYRFKKRSNGTYLYTASVSERYKLQLSPKTWAYEGTCFSTDSSATADTTKPVYRFYNYKTKKYSFTTSESVKKSRTTAKAKKTWKYSGAAFRVGKGNSAGAIKVYRFRSKKSGHVFLTKSTATVASMRTKTKAKTWKYEGVAYYLPRVPAPPVPTTPTPPTTPTTPTP